MYKYLFILFIVLTTYSKSNAQGNNNIDSLYSVLQQAKKNKDKAEMLIELSYAYDLVSVDSTKSYAAKALAIIDSNKQADLYVDALLLMGKAEKNVGNYSTALEFYLTSLRVAERLNIKDKLATLYNSIGIVYKKMKRWDIALEYYLRANTLAKSNNDLESISYTYNNIGTIHLAKEDWSKVLPYYDSALLFAEKANSAKAVATVLSNIGDVYMQKHRYYKALDIFKRCLKYDKQNSDQYGMFMSYFQIARVYVELQQYKIADKYVDSANNIAIKENFNRERIDILAWKGNIEESRGNYKEALKLLKLSKLLNDTLITEATTKQVSELETKYETEKKQQQIDLQKSEISRKNYIIFGVVAVFLLAILLSISYYNRYKLQQRDKLQKAIIKQQEYATQAVIEAEERERKRIAADLHDGVGQTMSAAKMNLSVISHDIPFSNEEQKAAFDKAMTLVDEGCKEVRSVSHQIMPNALLKSGLATAIREFLSKIDQRVLQVNLYTEGLDERLPDNVETVLYRVIQECVNNVIKHAQATILDMTLIQDTSDISITIEDNGKGFVINEAKRSNGIGLQNLETRIAYLKGSIEWDSTPNNGTVVTIIIPQPNVASA